MWLGPLRWWVPWKLQAFFAAMGRLMGFTPVMEKYTSKADMEAIRKAKNTRRVTHRPEIARYYRDFPCAFVPLKQMGRYTNYFLWHSSARFCLSTYTSTLSNSSIDYLIAAYVATCYF
jgi:hypothetical protein